MPDEFDRDERTRWWPESQPAPDLSDPDDSNDSMDADAGELLGSEADTEEWDGTDGSVMGGLESQELPEEGGPGPARSPVPSGVELPRRPLGWNGAPAKRGLVKPDEVRQAFSPHERLL